MRIQNIQLTNRCFGANSERSQNSQNPIQDSLKTTGTWLGFGVGLDYFSRKCVVFKNSPIKNSLCFNSALAIIAGGCTLFKDLRNNKPN